MKGMGAIAVILGVTLAGCASYINLDAIQAVQATAPPGRDPAVVAQERGACETEAVAAGAKAMSSSPTRGIANVAPYPLSELFAASNRDAAAVATYRDCLAAKGYTLPAPAPAGEAPRGTAVAPAPGPSH